MTDSPILIDLDNLTREMVEEALPHLGECSYQAPCIIGVLLPVDVRAAFDATEPSDAIDCRVDVGEAMFPNTEQLGEAVRLQWAFDSGDREAFLAHPRIAELMA